MHALAKPHFYLKNPAAEQTEGENSQSLESTFDKSTDSSSKILPRESEKKADSSPTATPRILEEDNQAECEKSPTFLESTFEKSRDCGANAPAPSLRDTAPAVARQSTQTKTQSLESVFEQNAPSVSDSQAAANEDSRSFDKEAQNVSKSAQDSSEVPFLSLRENPQGFSWQSISAQADSKQNAQILHEPQAEANEDSSNAFFASAKCMDCHADFQSARNDDKNAASKNEDSRSFTQNAQNLTTPQAEGFCDDFGGFQAIGKGATLAVVTADNRVESAKSAQKPTPKPQKMDSSNAAILNKLAKDSRIFESQVQNVFCSHATRRQDFCDKNGALQGESKARTWACATADSPQQSPFLAKKPTPKPQKAESTNKKNSTTPLACDLVSTLAPSHKHLSRIMG